VDNATLIRQAESGDPQAQFKLGVMYADGTVNCNQKNDAEAARWFRKAAVQGLAVAQERLAAMCESGDGITKDDAEASFWLILAREKRDKAGVNPTPPSASIAPELFLDQLTKSLKCKFGIPIVALIALVAFFFGIIPLSLAAWLSNVFFKEDLRDKCPPAMRSKQEKYQKEIDDIDKKLSDPDMSSLLKLGKMHASIKLRELREADLKKAENEVRLIPFFLSDLMYLWCATYPPLAILAYFSFSSTQGEPTGKAKWAALTIIGVGILYVCLIGIRNWLSVKSNDGRRIYSFANWDVSPCCFWVAVLCEFVIFAALSLIWYRWIVLSDLIHNGGASFATHVFHDWLVSSAFLAAAFLVFAWVYWDMVVVVGDRRYLLQAVLIQIAWGATWIVISLPLITVWGELDASWKVKFGSALAAVGSFVLPLLKAVLTPKEE
jgi:hypothetical protein